MMRLRPPVVCGMDATIAPMSQQTNKAWLRDPSQCVARTGGAKTQPPRMSTSLRSPPCLEELAACACPPPPWDKQTGFCLSSLHTTLPTWSLSKEV